MLKIIKITENDAIIGNTEDNSVKRVPISNCYEGMAVEDLVDFFQDGNEYFILKKVSSIPPQKNSGFSDALSNISVESVTNQGKKFFEQMKSSLVMDGETIKENSVDESQAGNPSEHSEKENVSLAKKNVGRLFNQFKNDVKEKNTWLGATIFVGLLFAVSLLISIAFKGMVSSLLDSYLGGMIDISNFSINPLLILGEIVFAGFNMSASFFGQSASGTFEVPIIIISIPIIAAGIFSVKLFYKSKSENLSKQMLLRKVLTSVLVGFTMLLLISLVYSQNMGFFKLHLDIFPMIFKGLPVVVILTFAMVSGLKFSDDSQIKIVANHILRHLLNVQFMGLMLALVVVLKNGLKETIILLGNIALWAAYTVLGGQISATMSGNTTQNLLETYIRGSSTWVWIIVIFVIMTIIIDLDDLKEKMPKMPDWKLSLLFSGAFTITVILVASLANIVVRQNGSQVGFVGVSIGSSVVTFLLLFGLGFVRLTYLNKLPVIGKFKRIWLSVTRARA